MVFFALYRRVLGLLAADRRVAIGLVAANAAVAGLQFVDPLLFGRVIGLLAQSDRLGSAALWTRAAGLLALWAAVGGLGIAANVATIVQAERMAHRNRLAAMHRFFGHALSLPLAFHGQSHSGRLMKAMLGGSDALFGLWLLFFRDQCATFLCTLVLLPLTLLLNWRLGLVLMALVAVFCTLSALVIRRTETAQRQVELYNSRLAGGAQDALANVVVVQSFTRLAAETRRFSEIMAQLVASQFPVLTWWALVNVLTRASCTVAVIAIVVIGTWLHVEGRATVGEIVAFMGLANLLIGRLEGAMQFVWRLFFHRPAIEEFFGVLDVRSSVPEAADARPLVALHGAVAFEGVSFGYPGGPPTLSDVSFTARPGSVVALVGHTGAGKSTAMNLLQRLWDPSAGRVLIDGQDLRGVTLESLRAAVGVVFQESLLFNRSIRDNLRIGRPEASDAEIERAARLADAHEFILRQPQGYETVVGERGATLSGGQRQRLAIARALLKDPPILVLDEATSALDAATEARVSQAMATLMRGRTTFVIAHRLSTVREADEILVFEHGRIIERGGFEALLARGGVFAGLVAAQLAPPPDAAAVPAALIFAESA